MGRRAGRGSVNIHKTSVKVASFPPYTLERVMATLNAWKFSTLQAGRKKPKTVILPVWRFSEGACEHALRP